MKNKIWVVTSMLLLTVFILGFNKNKMILSPNGMAYEQARQKATFKYTQDLYHSDVNKEIRAKQLVEKKNMVQQQEKNKVDAKQDKGVGQFKIKF